MALEQRDRPRRIKEEGAWQHQKTYSRVCYQLVEGLSQNLSPLLLWISKQVDYARHLRALQRRIFPACALATVVIEKTIIVGGVVQRNALLLTRLLSALEIWPQTSTLSGGGIEIGPRHAESCVVQPGGTGLTSWKGKGRGKSWNTGYDSHLPSPIIFRDRGNVPCCSLYSHTLSAEEQVFSALLSHICCQEKPGCWRYGKTNTKHTLHPGLR